MQVFRPLLLVLVLFASAFASAHAAAPPTMPRIPPLPPRDDAAARWTHGYDVRFEDLARTHIHDGFVGTPLAPPTFGVGGFGVASARGATRFVAGDAGPERFAVVVDPAHRLAFYSAGCCSAARAVLDGTLGPPPRSFARRDLSHVRTERGLALGDSSARVRALWGAATPRRIGGRTVYAYWSAIPPQPTLIDGKIVQLYAGCGQTLEAVVVRDRVVAIVIGTGC